MSYYIRCPSCQRVLTENYAEYMEELSAIQDDPEKTRPQAEAEIATLLDRYGHRRYCCRVRVKCAVPLHRVIQ